MTGRADPERICVGCRARAAKSDLLRVVAAGGACVPDPRGRLPGRGAHMHPDLRCLDLAERRRAFPRALRLPGPLDTRAVREHLEASAGQVTGRSAAPKSAAPKTSTETGSTVESGSGSRRG